MSTASKPTPDQLRAKHAWKSVQAHEHGNGFDHFVGAARKLPVRIMASGLGQALAFLNAKASKRQAYSALLSAIGDWVLNRPLDGIPSRQLPADDAQLFQLIEHANADKLREQTVETLAYLQWLNRFCEATGTSADVEE